MAAIWRLPPRPQYRARSLLAATTYVAPTVLLRQVEKQVVTFAAGSNSQNVTLDTTLLDTAKAFIVGSIQPSAAAPQFGLVTWKLASTTTVTLQRWTAAGSPAITVVLYIAEFLSGVTVQRGSVALATASDDITITSTNLTKSFPLICYRNAGNDYNQDDWVNAKITTSTNLNLSTNAWSTSNQSVEWQVIEYYGCSIQTGDVSFLTTDASKTATPTTTTGKDWLIINYTSPVGTLANIGQKMVRGRISATNELTFDRDNTGQSMALTYYLVTFTGVETVEQVLVAQDSSTTQTNTTITAIDQEKTLATMAGMYGYGGKNSYATTDDPTFGVATAELTSSTNLQTTRNATGSVSADFSVYVVAFEPAASVSAIAPPVGSQIL